LPSTMCLLLMIIDDDYERWTNSFQAVVIADIYEINFI
jgi:hypothetical protein